MFQEFITKENLALAGVTALFLWRIVDALIKLRRKEASETDKLAFDMVKAKLGHNKTHYNFPILVYFFLYRDTLRKKLRWPQGLINWFSYKEEELDRRIERLGFLIREDEKIDKGRGITPTWRNVCSEVNFLIKQTFKQKQFITKKVAIQNKYGERLAGLRDLPKPQRQKKYPTVILVHGFGADKREHGMFDDISKGLASEGYQMFRFDFAGCGESEGNYSTTTLTQQAKDLEIILNHVQTSPLTDNQRIGLLGMSLGTAVITALQPKNIGAFVYLSSVSQPHQTLKVLFGDGYHPDSMSTRITSEGRKVEVFPEFWKDFDKYDLPNLITNLKAPILFIHGEKDSKVGIESTQAYYEKANTPKELKVIKGADHGFYETNEREEMTNLVKDWFEKHMQS